MNKTQIEWVKNPDGSQGYTFNPITGCLNGCSYCYARKLANGRLRERYLANKNIALENKFDIFGNYQPGRLLKDAADPFYPRFWPERLMDKDLERMVAPIVGDREKYTKKQKGIFCCDMSDWIGTGVPESWSGQIMDVVRCSPHRFYFLTKQSQNLQKFSPFPDNAWVGVSLTAGESDFTDLYLRMYHLEKVEAKLKYISFEPLLGNVDLPNFRHYLPMGLKDNNIGWVIIGAQTKPYNPPKIEWVKEIVEAADRAGVPVFLKNNLKPLFHEYRQNNMPWNNNMPEWAFRETILRQEVPGG